MSTVSRWCLAFLLVALTSGHGMGAAFFDNFDAYADGSEVKGQGGWVTWDGTGPSGVISTAQAASGSQSLLIVGGNDTVAPFYKNVGVWEFKIKAFVPSDHVGSSFVILMAAYPQTAGGSGHTYYWAPQIEIKDAATINEGGASLPLVTDAWTEIKVAIDLVQNKKQITYNGTALGGETTWSGGPVALAVLDLYNDGAASAVYYDDLSLTDVTPADSMAGRRCRAASAAGSTTSTPRCGAPRRPSMGSTTASS